MPGRPRHPSASTRRAEPGIQGQRYSLPAAAPAGVAAMSLAARLALRAALLLLGFAYALRRC